MPEFLSKYYGFDIIKAIGVVLGIYLIGKKQRFGFIANAIGSAAGLVYRVMTDSVAIIILNVLLIILNTKGFFTWKNSQN